MGNTLSRKKPNSISVTKRKSTRSCVQQKRKYTLSRQKSKTKPLPKGVVLQAGRYRVTLTKYIPKQRPAQYCLGTYDTVEEASAVYAKGDEAWHNGTIDEFRATCRTRKLPIGVTRVGTKYHAKIQTTSWGTVHNLGVYDSAKQASEVYQKAKVASENGTLEVYKENCIELSELTRVDSRANAVMPFGLLPKTRTRRKNKNPPIKTEPVDDTFPVKRESAREATTPFGMLHPDYCLSAPVT